MKKLFFMLTAGFFCFTRPIQAATDAACTRLTEQPRINFYSSYGKLAYDFKQDQAAVTRIARRFGIIERGLFASGLAVVNVKWEISVNTLSNIMNNDDFCVAPSNIDIFIGYSDPVIYIADNLKSGSCEYNVVLRHEQTHQQINKTALDYFLPRFKKQIREIIAQTPPLQVTHIDEIDNATARLTADYNRQIAPLIEDFKRHLLQEQSKLDNHTNYEFESRLCRPENSD